MTKSFKLQFDPIEVLSKDTIHNFDFNPKEYSYYDVERLRNIANFIEKHLKEKYPIK